MRFTIITFFATILVGKETMQSNKLLPTRQLYKTTDYYAKDCEGAIVWCDPELNIQWPSIDGLGELLVNEKDREAKRFQGQVDFLN